MQCGPLASRETTETSQGRARYAADTHPHGSPSSASSSNTVVVLGLPGFSALAGTGIPTSLTPAIDATSTPAIVLDLAHGSLVPFLTQITAEVRVGRIGP